MKQHILRLILVMALCVFFGQADAFGADYSHRQFAQDWICETGAWSHEHHDAVLTSTQSPYRVYHSRQHRVQPTGCHRWHGGRLVCRYTFGISPVFVQPSQLVSFGKRRRETSPYPTVASCHYYVIALRHIIR